MSTRNRLCNKDRINTESKIILFSFSIILMVCFSSPKARCQSKTQKSNPDSITLKAKKLKQLYLLSTASSSINDTYKQKFFDEFPGTFKGLDDLYGYKEGKPAPLYNEAEKHILELFNNLDTVVNDTLYYKKIVSISIGGHWDADAVNYFQHSLRRKTESNPRLIVCILQKIPTYKIKSYWFFYFDGPHPQKGIPRQLEIIKSIDKDIYDTMIEAQKEVLKRWN